MAAKRSRRRTIESQPTSASETPASADVWWLIWALLAWVAAVHLSGIFGAFVFDDQSLLDNKSLERFWTWEWFVVTGRPLSTATFALNATYGGFDPLGFHLVNFVIHIAGVATLFAMVRRSLMLRWPELGRQETTFIAAAVALVWGVHPLSTSAVTYIVQRAESLASFLMLLSVFAWSRAFGRLEGESDRSRSTAPWALLSIAAAYAAYGSKEMSAGLPLIVLLYDRILIAKSWQETRSRWPWYAALLIPLVIGAALIIPRSFNSRGGRSVVGFGIEGLTPWNYFTSQPRVFLEYLRLSVFPVRQSLDYGWLPPRESGAQLAGIFGWIVLATATVYLWIKAKPLAFLLIAGFAVLAPTSTVMPLQDIIYEHRFYLPLACLLCGLLCWLFFRLRRNDQAESQRTAIRILIVGVVLAIPLSVRTVVRNQDYSSARRIHLLDTRNHPDNPRAWYALASKTQFDHPDQKVEILEKAIELSRQRDFFYAGTDYSWPRELADTLFLSGRASQSRVHYEEALPNSYDELQRTEILFQLAMIASFEGRNDDAEQLFQETLSGHPKIRKQVEKVYAAHKERLKNQ